MNVQTSSRDASSSREAATRGMARSVRSADAEQVAKAHREVLDQMAKRRGDGDRHTDRRKAGDREHDERPDSDLSAREPRDAFRVDEDLADLEPRDERRRHPASIPLEELDQVEVRSDRHDQLGALLEREQQREVLADARASDDLIAESELLRPLGARRAAV